MFWNIKISRFLCLTTIPNFWIQFSSHVTVNLCNFKPDLHGNWPVNVYMKQSANIWLYSSSNILRLAPPLGLNILRASSSAVGLSLSACRDCCMSCRVLVRGVSATSLARSSSLTQGAVLDWGTERIQHRPTTISAHKKTHVVRDLGLQFSPTWIRRSCLPVRPCFCFTNISWRNLLQVGMW